MSKTNQSEESVQRSICLIPLFLFIVLPISLIILVSIETPPTKFSIDEASIIQFNLINNNTLYYNFKVIITARNFHDRIKYYKRGLNAIFTYKGNTLAWVKMEPFAIGRKNIVTLQPIVLAGNSLMKLEPQQLVEYNMETQLGIYEINLDFLTKVHCPSLKIPLISNGKLAPTYNVTACWTKDDRDYDISSN
jgi:hypothetical protein